MSNRVVVKSNGVTHVGTWNQETNSYVYDPPMPIEQIRQSRKNMKEMLESRSFPNLKTETNFFSGRKRLADQFADDPWYLQQIIEGARARGYEPTGNEVWVEGLADGTGDPDGLISPAEGVSKIRKVCEKKKLKCEGIVNYTPTNVEPPKKKRLAENLVGELISKYRRTKPEYERASDAELREEVISKHGAKKES